MGVGRLSFSLWSVLAAWLKDDYRNTERRASPDPAKRWSRAALSAELDGITFAGGSE